MQTMYRTIAADAADGTTRLSLGEVSEVTVDEVIEVVRAMRAGTEMEGVEAEVVERGGVIYVDGAVVAEAVAN